MLQNADKKVCGACILIIEGDFFAYYIMEKGGNKQHLFFLAGSLLKA